MWGISKEQAPLLQGLKDEGDVSLLEIAYTPVDKFRAAARCSLRKILLLDKKRLVTSGGRINGATQSRRTPSDDDTIPYLRGVLNPCAHVIAIH